MRRGLTSVSVALVLSSCLPISRHAVNRDTQIKLYDKEEQRGDVTLQAQAQETAVALDVVVTSQASCTIEQHKVVRRFTKIEKSTNPWVHGALYLVGLGGLGLAGYILYDNLSVDNPADRKFPIGSTTKEGQYVGIGVSAAAGLMLLIALGSSAAAIDEVGPTSTVDLVVANSKKAGECGSKPAAGVYVGLVFSTGGLARVYVPVGKTDGKGHVAVSWATVQSQLPTNARPEANLVAGAPEKVGAALMQNGPLDALATIVMPAGADPEQAWSAALAADTGEAYRGYAQRFPDSTHVAEAIERAKAADIRAATLAFEKAIAGEQLDAAATALAQIKLGADAATIAAAQERLDKMRRTVRGRDAQVKYPQLVAAIETANDPVVALADARAALEALKEATPDQASRLEEQLNVAQTRATEKFVRAGREAALARDFATAGKNFAFAAAISPTPAAVEKARVKALADAIKAGQAEARKLAQSGNYDGAIALADQLLAASPDAKSVASDRAKWKAAGERAQKLAEQRAIADAEAQRRRDEREAAKQAEKDKAAADAAAREQKLAEARQRKQQEEADRKTREEQRLAEARAKKEQEEAERRAKKDQAEADRKAREDAARVAAEDKKRKAEEQRAAAKAAEAAKVEEQRRQADAAKAKQEEERRQAAAAKLDAQLAKKAAASGPFTVQFALPARFATDDVLKRLPVPKSCTATIKRFFAKPTTCPTCAARAMSRVEMSCSGLGFSFLNDQRDVWLTCTGEKQTCQDCLGAGTAALSPFIDAKEKLQTVQGCPKK